jgi:hypothetical protein
VYMSSEKSHGRKAVDVAVDGEVVGRRVVTHMQHGSKVGSTRTLVTMHLHSKLDLNHRMFCYYHRVSSCYSIPLNQIVSSPRQAYS